MYKALTLAALAISVSAIRIEKSFQAQTRPENACDDCMCGKAVQCSNNKCPDGTYRDKDCKCPAEFEGMRCAI